jgi:hypothetical protein
MKTKTTVEEEAFIASTSRMFSQFERVKMKTIIRDDKSIVSNIERAMHRIDPASTRDKEGERKRRRDREREQ